MLPSIPTQATLQMAAGIAGALAGLGVEKNHERSWRLITNIVVNMVETMSTYIE